MPNVTTNQDLTYVNYVDVDGSSFAYTPPSDANTVIYEFITSCHYTSSGQMIFHVRFFLDNTEVTCKRHSYYNGFDNVVAIKIPLSLNNTTEDIANGKVGSWTSNKTMKLQARSYSSYYQAGLNQIYHWDGGSAYQLIKPTLELHHCMIMELPHQSTRRLAYGTTGAQLDMLWHAIDADEDLKVKFAGFYNHCSCKEQYPAPEG